MEYMVVTTDAEVDTALERALSQDLGPTAQTLQFDGAWRTLTLTVRDGRHRTFAIQDLQGLEAATPAQLAAYELVGDGTGIHFPALDVFLYAPALMDGLTGTKAWMGQSHASMPADFRISLVPGIEQSPRI